MNLEELGQLVARGESERLEFKTTTGQRVDATKTVCALLNGQGGYVLFGISDKGEILGQHFTTKTLEDIAVELRRIDPPAFFNIETLAIGDEKAVIILCVPGNRGIYAYNGRAYVRHGPTTQIMPPDEHNKRLLEKFHTQRRWENEPAPAWVTLDHLDVEEIQLTLQNAVALGRMNLPLHTDTVAILRGLNLFDTEGQLLNAAVALYGKSQDLGYCFTQLSVRLGRFRGIDKLSGFIDNRQYWGNAFKLLRRSEAFLLAHTPISGRVVSGKLVREDYPLYPPRATREALANALCHRDYVMPGGAIFVAMYDDRLEITSPGTLHFDITPQTLTHPHISKPWNPLIANAFYRAGIIETWGAGTLNMIDFCQKNTNPAPIWTVDSMSVTVTFLPTFFFATGKRPEEVEKEKELEGIANEQEAETQPVKDPEKAVIRARPKAKKAVTRREPLEDTILYVLSKGPLSQTEIARNLGHKTAPESLKKILQHLLEQKQIALIPSETPRSPLPKYTLFG